MVEKTTVARRPCGIKHRLQVKRKRKKSPLPYCLPGGWMCSFCLGRSMNGGVKRIKYEGMQTCSFVRSAVIRGPSAGREAAAATASGGADKRAEASSRPGGRSARAHARLDANQCTVTLPLSYLPACPGGRGERGPAEEHEQAEQEHEQNQTRWVSGLWLLWHSLMSWIFVCPHFQRSTASQTPKVWGIEAAKSTWSHLFALYVHSFRS